MDVADNVVAFGGYTPAFLLVDPYGGKAPPSTREIEDAAEFDDAEDAREHHVEDAPDDKARDEGDHERDTSYANPGVIPAEQSSVDARDDGA